MRTAFVLLLCFCSTAAATNVWIDTDPSIGSLVREVDDAFALVLAFHSPELRIVGISATRGNADLRTTTRVARELVRKFGYGNVYTGGAPAAEALAHALRQQRLTYIALGPLTNLALFLRLHPQLAQRIERVIFVGNGTGERVKVGPLRVHDANVVKDRAAFEVVRRCDIPLLLVPLETAKQLALTKADLDVLAMHGGAAQYIYRNSKIWSWFWNDLLRNQGAPVFDALAVAAAVWPRLVRIDGQICTGFSPELKRLVVHRLASESPRQRAPRRRCSESHAEQAGAVDATRNQL